MKLEPTSRVVFMVVLAHAAGWWWMTHASAQAGHGGARAVRWFSPKDIATPLAQAAEPEMIKQQSSPETAPVPTPPPEAMPRKAKLEVVLSHNTSDAVQSTPTPVGVDMTRVDQAIVDEFKMNWVLPADFDTRGTPREARMDVVVAHDGGVRTCRLAQPSGHSMVDMAVLRAADLVNHIPESLPPQFLGDSYAVQLHFRAQ